MNVSGSSGGKAMQEGSLLTLVIILLTYRASTIVASFTLTAIKHTSKLISGCDIPASQLSCPRALQTAFGLTLLRGVLAPDDCGISTFWIYFE